MAGLIVLFVLLLVASFMLAVAEASWRFHDEEEITTDSAAILRTLMLAGVVAVSAGWFGPALGAAFTLIVFALQQVVGQLVGSRGFAGKIAATISPTMHFAEPLVAWLRIHKPEPTPELEQELIESVEEFSDTVVREVMVPRVDLTAVAAEQTLEESLSLFVTSGYSRLPVFEKSIDDIVGVLYLKDIARVTHQDPMRLATETAGQIARRAIFVPETKPVADLLREMQQAATQIAIVADEYGGVAGIATVEDLIEEIVGEISDEYDRDEAEIEQISENLFRVSPRTNIFELAEHFEIQIDVDDVDTVGGLLTKLLGALPKGGDRVEVAGLELTAERVDSKKQRLQSLLVRRIEEAA